MPICQNDLVTSSPECNWPNCGLCHNVVANGIGAAERTTDCPATVVDVPQGAKQAF